MYTFITQTFGYIYAAVIYHFESAAVSYYSQINLHWFSIVINLFTIVNELTCQSEDKYP